MKEKETDYVPLHHINQLHVPVLSVAEMCTAEESGSLLFRQEPRATLQNLQFENFIGIDKNVFRIFTFAINMRNEKISIT
jgi:hypothetical protein